MDKSIYTENKKPKKMNNLNVFGLLSALFPYGRQLKVNGEEKTFPSDFNADLRNLISGHVIALNPFDYQRIATSSLTGIAVLITDKVGVHMENMRRGDVLIEVL